MGFLRFDPAPEADALEVRSSESRDALRKIVSGFGAGWTNESGTSRKHRRGGRLSRRARGDFTDPARVFRFALS